MKFPTIAAGALLALSGPAFALDPLATEDCNDTSWSALAATSCAGAFIGNINGSSSEFSDLNSLFGGTWTSTGTNNTANGTSTGGTLTFSSAMSGWFAIGLKAADQYSYYLFNALAPISSLSFDTTAGVAVNAQGVPQAVSHAEIYAGRDVPVPNIPEPSTYALMVAGLGLVGFMARRRARK